jgi:geranylgeranyl diphosphate synthase, type II
VPVATVEPYLEIEQRRVEQELDQILPRKDAYPSSIHRAMRYAVFAGGKRLRPILCIETGRLFGGAETALLRVAAALELIHTYSLIHDDLPALDNDDMRRGKPTCHRAFGEATAILAGDALLTLAFETLSFPGLMPADRQLRLVHDLGQGIGTRGGMVGGQVVDLETAGGPVDAVTLEYIHAAKTGSFIRATVRAGALTGGASHEDLSRVTAYGEKVGLAFQIADDLLDVLGSTEAMGKAVGKDHGQSKATYPGLYGVEESQRIAAQLVNEAIGVLAPYGERGQRLKDIAQFLIARNC